MKQRASIATMILAFVAIGLMGSTEGCGGTASAKDDSSWKISVVHDDDKVDLYEVTDKVTGKRYLANSRGGLLPL